MTLKVTKLRKIELTFVILLKFGKLETRKRLYLQINTKLAAAVHHKATNNIHGECDL